GEFPEAGFSIEVNNQNLEKLIAAGEKGKKYLFSLLKETRSGYTKERILREISRDAAEKDLNEFDLKTLYLIIKDRSSAIRFLTVRLLGEKGSSDSISKINPLLYDPFVFRKDVYPVRIAAREAIELIKIREEANTLPEEERAVKWLQVIREKAFLRQDYFCEKAVKEIALLTAQKESVWAEVTAAKEMVGKKTLINNKIFSYLLLSASNLKDERTLPLIEKSLKDTSLVNAAVRAAVALSIEKTTDFLLKEPVNSGNAALMIEALKEKLTETETVEKAGGESFVVQPPFQAAEERKFFGVDYSAYDKESFDAVVKNVKQILLTKRDNEAYKDAGEMYASGLNDFNRALFYFSLYENAGKETKAVPEDVYDVMPKKTPSVSSWDEFGMNNLKTSYRRNSVRKLGEVHFEFLARCLANAGKIQEAENISPLMDFMPYLVNLKLAEILTKEQVSDPITDCRRNYWRAKTFLEISRYQNALSLLKKLGNSCCSEISEQFIKDNTAFSEGRIKEETEAIMADLDITSNEELTLEISTEKPEYNKDEEIKIKLLLKNAGSTAVSGINEVTGNFGFDFLVMQEGRLVKRLKKGLFGEERTEEQQTADVFTLEPGTAFSSEIIAFSAAEEKPGQEAELILSYVGGPQEAGEEKNWIKHPVISNELIIKIRK
ncbi:MAG: hypothetical protein V1752_06665, partial [Candidatus Firestonebacteria bacterium]